MNVLLRRNTIASRAPRQVWQLAGGNHQAVAASAVSGLDTTATKSIPSPLQLNYSTGTAQPFSTFLQSPSLRSLPISGHIAEALQIASPSSSSFITTTTADYLCPSSPLPYTHNHIRPAHALTARRHFHSGLPLREQASSKVEETVKALQTKQDGVQVAKPPPPKKSIGTRVWEEVLHYYHGFRLLFIDMNVARKLVWKTLRGQTLTRREYMLLIRTTGDVFRLLPFSVFIIVPFMELLLPVFIKFFPGMLPSTFETAKDMELKARANLKVKIEMAKFLQKTLDEMDVQNRNHSSDQAREFSEFFHNLRTSGERATPEDIMKFSKLFEDEITLDSLSKEQLAAICRVLEVSTIGTSAVMRFQLRMKVRSLAADDRMIQKEGVESLSLAELQAASRARGMRSYGLSLEQLRGQISEWIHLSLNEKVPPSLLLLSRVMMLPEDISAAEKLRASMAVLNESAAIQTKAAIGEREGKIDNKTKIEIIRDEQRKIKEELEEEVQQKQEQEKEQEVAVGASPDCPAPVKLTKAQQLANAQTVVVGGDKTVSVPLARALGAKEGEDASASVCNAPPGIAGASLSAKDIEVVSDAIGLIGKGKKALLMEKEEMRELKEEIAEYREDVEELDTISKTVEKPSITESTASKHLLKRVDQMISKLDAHMAELEEKETKLQADLGDDYDKTELVHIEEIIATIRKMQKVPDEDKLKKIQEILAKMDDDRDGHLKIDDVLRIVQEIGKETVSLSPQQVEELMQLINKEEELENEQKVEKALAKSLEEKKRAAEELTDKQTKVLSADGAAAEELSDATTKTISAEEKAKADAQKIDEKHPSKIEERINKSVIDSAEKLAQRQAGKIPSTAAAAAPSASAKATSSSSLKTEGSAGSSNSSKML